MAEFTVEKFMYGEKYNIESSVFMAVYELAKQGIKPADIRDSYRCCMLERQLRQR